MMDFNTVKGCHFKLIDGNMSVDEKEYYWHIPKHLRELDIKKGDIILVSARGRQKQVLVVDMLREDIEVTGKRYKPVLGKVKNRNKSHTEDADKQ